MTRTQASRIRVVVGSNIELISQLPRLSKLGETLVGKWFHMGYGGKGANQAVMAAKLGARVTAVISTNDRVVSTIPLGDGNGPAVSCYGRPPRHRCQPPSMVSSS
jgi:ribokinase